MNARAVALLLLAGSVPLARGQVERIWLTHRSPSPDRVIVNWQTVAPGESTVLYRAGDGPEQRVSKPGSRLRHEIEIPLDARDAAYRYSVQSGAQTSPPASFQGPPSKELRVAVVADWGFARRDLGALLRDAPHLLLSAGDNVPDLHSFPGATPTNRSRAFERLIDSAPELFRTTPFLPVLGNHDREVRPRGPRPPAEPVYDVEARDFLSFFPLPGDGWKWRFEFPAFDVRFAALDLSHISDQGTTWQTCHPLGPDSAQLQWYRGEVGPDRPGFVVTLYNERHASVRAQAGGEWGRLLARGTLAITGFGHFAERAEVDGVGFYNVSLDGRGAQYPDPQKRFLAGGDAYLLMTFRAGAADMTAEIKGVGGAVLDRKTWTRRAASVP